MAYVKTIWVNGAAPPISATNLNKIEDGIFDNDSNLTSHIANIFPHFGYAFTQEILYTGDDITQIDSKIATVLRLRETVTYVGDEITEINIKVFDDDGVTILQEFTDTISYDDDKIDEITRTVV
jgi:hypothetical protein